MTPGEVLNMAQKNGAKVVDLRFMDYPGLWQHFTVPMGELDESSFEDGFGFDGSSIRGWQPIHASDMLVIPDPVTAKMDPFYKEPTLVLICNIFDPVTPGALQQGSTLHCSKGRSLSEKHRYRRYRFYRAGG